MVIIACVRHQLSVMGMRTQYALGPDNPVKLKANLRAGIKANVYKSKYLSNYTMFFILQLALKTSNFGG